MSEPAAATGRTREAECRQCSETFLQSEFVGMYEGKTWWGGMEAHTAPCGLPCFGGGARGRDGLAAYKARKMHGIAGHACPGCHPEEDPNGTNTQA